MTSTIAPASALLDTPVGRLAVVVDADGAVLASGFGDPLDLARRRGFEAPLPAASKHQVADVADSLRRYFAGDLSALDDVTVRQPGGAFQQRAWQQLRETAPGRPITYADLADRAGSPGAARAAGQACARNLAAPFVPCHRVLRTGGGVGGYAYGADVKRRLLDHERAAA